MKVKVHGLVFVGFAAAILAGAAHAGDENIVTSKAYTDATYEALAHKETTAESLTTNKSSTTNYPSNAAITAYVDTAVQNVSNTVTGDYQTKIGGTNGQVVTSTGTSGTVGFTDVTSTATSGSNALITSGGVYAEQQLDEKVSNRAPSINNTMGSATTYPTTGAVVTYAQEKDGTDTYKVSKNGAWQAANTAIGVTGPITKADNNDGSATIGVNTASGFTNVETEAGQTGIEDGYLPTARAVKEYVDSQVTATANDHTYSADEITVHKDANNQFSALTGTVANDAQTLTTGDQVYEYVQSQLTTGGTNGNGYQEKSTALSVGGSNGSWVPAASSVTNDATTVPTTAAVYSYVQSQTGGVVIPAQNPSICGANNYAPCALVYEASGPHWRTMATDQHAGGTCGDLGDSNCDGQPDA